MANVELLRETMQYIKNNPQSWRQDVWFTHLDPETGRRTHELVEVEVEEVNSCKTAFCFAGHAALKSGFPSPPKDSYTNWIAEINGENVWVDAYAARQLGITYDQAEVLFAGENSMEELEVLVEAIINKPDITSDDLERLLGRYSDCPCCADDDDDDDEDVW